MAINSPSTLKSTPNSSLIIFFFLIFYQNMKFSKFPLIKTHSTTCILNLIIISISICMFTYLLSSLIHLPTTSLHHISVPGTTYSPTSLQHIVFGIASNQLSWPRRKDYVRMWWRPHHMRGCVFLDKNITNHDGDDVTVLPPVCVSEDTSRFRYTYRNGLRSAIRVARVVSETVALDHTGVRWFVFGDDDTVFFPDNLVKTLSKYDHDLWYFIGTNSESYAQNKFFSFNMAFGGAGFAISYPLAKVLAKVFDSCLERYPHLYGSDGRISSCLAELGVGLTREPGFHQMDIAGSMFGILASHPLTPLISLHHLDFTDPIFPGMSRTQALKHLHSAANVDPQRILQQTVCYDRWFAWTISISWGYAVQVFSKRVLLSDVVRTQETFRPWKNGNGLSMFNFDTREHHRDPCQRPTTFFLDRVGSGTDGMIKSYYKQMNESCPIDMVSPRRIEEIIVSTHKLDLDIKQLQAPRRQCCDVFPSSKGKILEIGIRDCQEEELIYMGS